MSSLFSPCVYGPRRLNSSLRALTIHVFTTTLSSISYIRMITCIDTERRNVPSVSKKCLNNMGALCLGISKYAQKDFCGFGF